MIPLQVQPADKRIPGRISVILPSRGRAEMLAASLKSLYDNLGEPVESPNIEVFVAVDPDDNGYTFRSVYRSDFDYVGYWQSMGRYGYGGIANYYVPLLEMARGEWVLLWGDDALMRTKGWDEIIRESPVSSVLYTKGNPDGHNCFPIVHMDIFEALGRFTGLPAVDTWYDEVGRWSGRWVETDIEIFQDRPDLTGKKPDATYTEGRTGYRTQEYYNPYWTMMRKEDARTVFEKFGPLGTREESEFWLAPVTDVETTMDEFGFAGFDDILKTNDDLQRYQRIIEEDRPEVIIECGTRNGASAVWFAHEMGVPVVTIDIQHIVPQEWIRNSPTISWIIGDSVADETYQQVLSMTKGLRTMVILDSDHTRDHVFKEMSLYAPLVSEGCHLVVEDGIFRFATPAQWVKYSFGNPSRGNPLDAIEDYMSAFDETNRWRRDLEIESMSDLTHHVAGFWKRSSP